MKNKIYSYNNKKIIRLGHRGLPRNSIENTLESFEEALNSELDGIELDVQCTLDNKIIVYHNWDIKTEFEKYELIKNLSYAEINIAASKLNYKVPLLEEVLELIVNNCIINIEIKSLSLKNSEIEKTILNLLYFYKLENNCIISSFNPFVLRRLKKTNPKINTAFLWTKNNSQLIFNTLIWIWFCKPNGLHIDIDLLDSNLIKWIRRNNLSIMVYTIKNEKEYEKTKSFKIDGYIIDQQNFITI